MRYGYFDDKNREYVITRPDTPLPGSTIWAAKIILDLYHIPPAGIHFIKTPACAA